MKERGKPINAARKEGQQGGFQDEKEVINAHKTGMGALCQAVRLCKQGTQECAS